MGQKIKDKYEAYRNELYANDPHNKYEAYDNSFLYHCTSPMNELNFPIWDCILNVCSLCTDIKITALYIQKNQ